MIDGSDSPVTTQTNTSCLNSIPSRLVSWLYSRLVSIAEAVKRVFSRGNMAQSESLPEARPLAERTSSEVKAEITFLHMPDPQVTAPSQEVEFDNEANRPLPVLNGGEVLCLSRKVEPILDGMKTIFEKLKQANSSEFSKGELRAEDIKQLCSKEHFDESIFMNLLGILKIADEKENLDNMPVVKKINYLLCCNAEQMRISAECFSRAITLIISINGITLPSVHERISSLAKKYSDTCTELASKEDIRELQEKVEDIQCLLDEGIKGLVWKQITLDADLQETLSDIREKLQNITQTLQM